jgi:hypothetical protein
MACKVLRVGVFFDGTGNNKANDLAGISTNGLSNIAKLSELYYQDRKFVPKDNEEYPMPIGMCEVNTKMIYIEGVGTTEGGENDNVGLAAGSGGAQRINDAIDKVLVEFKTYPVKKNYKRIIDVFGFSRGAAMARDFINTFNERNGDLEKLYKFGFVGLYDTVGSFGSAGDNENLKPIKPDKYQEHEQSASGYVVGMSEGNKNSIRHGMFGARFGDNFEDYRFDLNKSVQNIDVLLHLTAAQEYRKNFPLTNIVGSGGQEHALLGVHSDIGGGYPDNTTENATIQPDSFWRSGLFDGGATKKAKASANAYQKKYNQGRNGDAFPWVCETKRNGIWNKVDVVCKQTRNVTDDLQKSGLGAIFNRALRADVPLDKNKGLGEDGAVPMDLQGYYCVVSRSPAKAKGHPDKNFVLAKYAHHSSVDTEEALTGKDADGSVGEFLGANDMRYDNDSPSRVTFANNASNAVVNPNA